MKKISLAYLHEDGQFWAGFGEGMRKLAADQYLYHYLFDDPDKTARELRRFLILRSISDLPGHKRQKDYSARAKEHGYGDEAADYFKGIYNDYYKPVMQKPYRNYGVFSTPIDLGGLGDFKYRVKIPVNSKILNNSVYSYGLDRMSKLTPELIRRATEEMKGDALKKIWEGAKFKFKEIPQVTTFVPIKLKSEWIERLTPSN